MNEGLRVAPVTDGDAGADLAALHRVAIEFRSDGDGDLDADLHSKLRSDSVDQSCCSMGVRQGVTAKWNGVL